MNDVNFNYGSRFNAVLMVETFVKTLGMCEILKITNCSETSEADVPTLLLPWM